jgi:cytochrome c-type biogenesis protein
VAQTIQALVLDANLIVAAAIALAAGLVSFASPCVVPLVPGYLSYITGLSAEELARGESGRRARVLAGSLLFVIGFAVPFTMLGFAAGLLNLLDRSRWADLVLGGLVIVFGILMARGRLVREVRVSDRAPSGSLGAAVVLGFVFGVGWTPCLGPAAGAILTLSAGVTGGVSGRGALLGFVYAAGLGIPFVVFALAFHRLGRTLDLLKRNARRLQVAGGTLLALVGVAIATGLWDRFMLALRPLIQGVTLPI